MKTTLVAKLKEENRQWKSLVNDIEKAMPDMDTTTRNPADRTVLAYVSSTVAALKLFREEARSYKLDLQEAIAIANRYGEIIDAMSQALQPKVGESNIAAAKRVAAELAAFKAEARAKKLGKWTHGAKK